MKNFFDNVFKPYLFPVIILFGGAYLKAGENLKTVTEFFSKSSNGFIKFFSSHLFLWEVLIYLLIAYLFIKVGKRIIKPKSKRERKMLRAIRRTPHEYQVTFNGSPDRYLFKFEPIVSDGDYFLDNFRPYCQNCNPSPVRMSVNGGYDEFRCNCGRIIGFTLCQDVRSRITTMIESNE